MKDMKREKTRQKVPTVSVEGMTRWMHTGQRRTGEKQSRRDALEENK